MLRLSRFFCLFLFVFALCGCGGGDGAGTSMPTGNDENGSSDVVTDEEPTDEEPTDEEPTEQEPTDEEPTDEEPTEQEPTEQEPTDEEPGEPACAMAGEEPAEPFVQPARAVAEYGGTTTDAALDASSGEWLPEAMRVFALLVDEFMQLAPPCYVDAVVNAEENGFNAGTVTVTGEYKSTGEDWFVFEYENYVSLDDERNGVLMQETRDFDPATYRTSALLSFYDLEIVLDGEVYRVRGTLDITHTGWVPVATGNLVLSHAVGTRVVYFDDFTMTHRPLGYGDEQISWSGTIFDSVNGGLQVATVQPFSQWSFSSGQEWLFDSGMLRLSPASGDSGETFFTILNPHFGSFEWANQDGAPVTVRMDMLPVSLPDFVSTRTKPLADAGPFPYEPYRSGDTVPLEGRFSVSYRGEPLTYEWQLVAAPRGSSATINATNAPSTSITTDLPGTYVVRLTVDDGVQTDTDLVSFQASDTVLSRPKVPAVGVQVIPANASESRAFIDARAMLDDDQKTLDFTYLGGIEFLPEKDSYPDPLAEPGFAVVDLAGFRGALAIAPGGMVGEGVNHAAKHAFSPAFGFHFGLGVPLDSVAGIALEDVTNDGVKDLLVQTYYSYSGDGTAGGIHVYQGTGDGHFGAGSVAVNATAKHSGFAIGDVTGDGNDEIVVLETCWLAVYENDGSGMFTQLAEIARSACDTYDDLQPPFIVDLDADGQATILMVEDHETLRFVELDSAGTVSRNELLLMNYELPTDSATAGKALVKQVKAVDMNLDGKLDLVISNGSSSTASEGGFTIFLQQEDDSTYAQGISAGFNINVGARLAIADVNGDGYDDLIGAAGNHLQVWTAGSGGAVMTAEFHEDSTDDSIPDIATSFFVVAELDDDIFAEIFLPSDSVGTYDSLILEFNSSGGIAGRSTTVIPEAPGGGTALEFSIYSLDGQGWSGIAQDIDGDGKTDLLLPEISGIELILQR